MKHLSFSTKSLVAGLTLAVGLAFATGAQAETKQGKAEVKAIRGTAKYSTGGNVWVPLKVGTVLRSGAIIQTAMESTVDLFLGQNGPVVRMTPETTLSFDKLVYTDTGADTVVDTQLNLQSGRILGNVKKLAAASHYEIKLPTGVAGIRGTDYDVTARKLGNGKYEIRVTSITGTLIGSAVVGVDPVTAVINTGETWTPEGGVEKLTPEILAHLQTEIQVAINRAEQFPPQSGPRGTPIVTPFDPQTGPSGRPPPGPVPTHTGHP